MNQAQLEAMKPKELFQYANDLGVKTKGLNPRQVVPLVLAALDGSGVPDEGDATGEESGQPQPSRSEIIAGEKDLLDAEDDETDPNLLFDAMTEEEVLEHQIQQAEDGGAHPAVIAALVNAKNNLAAVNQAPVEQPPAPPPAGTATQPYQPRQKAGSHYPTVKEVHDVLAGHVKRGLKIVSVDQKVWHIQHNNREAAGTMKMPLRTLLMQANILMRPTGRPTEDMSYEEIMEEQIRKKSRK